MSVRGDQPLKSISLWSIRSNVSVAPDKEFRWMSTYSYYTIPYQALVPLLANLLMVPHSEMRDHPPASPAAPGSFRIRLRIPGKLNAVPG